jgi:hypothetical protein
LVEFLNEQLHTVEVLAVEVPQFVSSETDTTALVPRLIGKTARADAAKGRVPAEEWDHDRFMDAIRQLSAEAEQVAEAIHEWMTDKSHCDHIGWGAGQRDGSMIAFVKGTGQDEMPWGQIPFTVWTYGRVEIDFQYLKRYEPFSDDSLRLEMLGRLNQIPGIQLPLDGAERRPSAKLSDLKGESLPQFLGVMSWVTDTIRRGSQLDHDVPTTASSTEDYVRQEPST